MVRRELIKVFLVVLICSNISLANAQNSNQQVESPFNHQQNETVHSIPNNTSQKESLPLVKPVTTIKKTVKKYENPIVDPSNTLGTAYSESLISKTNTYIKQNNIVAAKATIEPVVKWLQQATEYHTYLYRVLKDIDSAKTQADLERELALKFAVARDKAAYQYALLLIEDKKYQPAVDKLVEVIRSQPNSQLGFAAYEVLQQIGFTYKVIIPDTDAEPTDATPSK